MSDTIEELKRTLRGIRDILDGAKAPKDAVEYTLKAIHRYGRSVTVVDTGTQRKSLEWDISKTTDTEVEGHLYYEPEWVNPKGGRPAEYGPKNEFERGGRYATFQKTFDNAADNALSEAMEGLLLEVTSQ